MQRFGQEPASARMPHSGAVIQHQARLPEVTRIHGPTAIHPPPRAANIAEQQQPISPSAITSGVSQASRPSRSHTAAAGSIRRGSIRCVSRSNDYIRSTGLLQHPPQVLGVGRRHIAHSTAPIAPFTSTLHHGAVMPCKAHDNPTRTPHHNLFSATTFTKTRAMSEECISKPF